VTPDRLDRANSTAQIVLVGAVAMAFIIVGLVLVANTVLYTESVGAEGSLGSADETGEFQRVARDSTASTVYRVNERSNFSTRSALDTAVRDNVTALSNLLATEYGQEYGVFVDVEADLANSEYGARVEQDTFTFFNNSGSDIWTPVATPTSVAEFDATFDVSEMKNQSLLTDQFYMRIEGDSGDERYLSFYNRSGDLAISSDASSPTLGSISPDCTVSTGDRVLVDVSNGSVPGTDCTFDGLDALEAPYTIEFNNSDEAVGTYSFVAADESLATDSKYANFSGGQPYSSFVYWNVAVDITYEGSEVAYELERTVSIYNPASDVRRYSQVIQPRDRTANQDGVTYDINMTLSSGSDADGNSLNSLEIDVVQNSDTEGLFTNATQDELVVIGIDEDGDGVIETDLSGDIESGSDDGWKLQDDNTTLKIEFTGNYNLEAGDRILLTFNNGSTPASVGDYSVDVTVNGEDTNEGWINTTAA
jgi:hypothetical protein